MRRISWLLIVSFVLLAGDAAFAQGPPVSGTPGVDSVARGGNTFAADLYAELRGKEGNLFFSPYSISSALAMTYGGARGNTATQMADVLHFDLPGQRLHAAYRGLMTHLNSQQRKGSLRLNVANALWAQKDYRFLPEFTKLCKDNYGAGLQELDFAHALEAARTTINDWVEKKTEGKIKDLIPPGAIGPLTRMVLTNAIYFKGDWQHKFKEAATRDARFWTSAAEGADVPTMHQVDSFGYRDAGDCQVLEMPYMGGGQSMVVLLPKERDGLAAFEEKLTSERLADLTAGIRYERVNVSLPKFTFTSSFSLGAALKSLGMLDAFAPGAADFSGMTGSRDLFIGAVIHKAFVDVYEEGTEAAAATAVMMVGTAFRPQEPKVFKADHPFVFVIRDRRTGAVLFMGRVAHPKG